MRHRPDPRSAPWHARHPAGERGFTLAEMLVTLVVSSVVLTGIVALFNFNTRVAKAQMSLSEMQQSLRVAQSGMVRTVRMAGRGGLPVFRPGNAGGYAGMFLPQGPAIGVANDVADGTQLGSSATAAVVAGTDVLTVRGVINSPLYQVNPAGGGNIRGAAAARGGSVVIDRIGPTGVPQDLAPLVQSINTGNTESILLISAGSDQVHAIVELTGGAGDLNQVTLNFTLDGVNGQEYLALSPDGDFPAALRTVGALGILEEYRYYVRDVAPAPRLSRARFWPGTETAYLGDNANLAVDIADNILDLQIALGVDVNGDLVLTDNGDATDEWMFNHAGDDPPVPANWVRPLYFVRITTLARTSRLDPSYVSPPLVAIEDRRYDEPATPTSRQDRFDRSYRRRQLQTVVDLRNLT